MPLSRHLSDFSTNSSLMYKLHLIYYYYRNKIKCLSRLFIIIIGTTCDDYFIVTGTMYPIITGGTENSRIV